MPWLRNIIVSAGGRRFPNSFMKGPERIETGRLLLRKPILEDAEAVFSRYSSDLELTKYLGWPRHSSVESTKLFLKFSDAEWNQWPAGPYLIESKSNQRLLGSTGFGFETSTVSSTGYVLAQDAWGYGYATEALSAIVVLAADLGISQLYALCHPRNPASMRVLEKCGFTRENTLARHVFPNLGSGQPEDCFRYIRNFD
jgi:[ribosomal protein S5]-alanine N-acetyltransferase